MFSPGLSACKNCGLITTGSQKFQRSAPLINSNLYSYLNEIVEGHNEVIHTVSG